MSVLSAVLLLALSRAEILARFRAPVVTQADGLVQVYADCPEDMRREYQSPVARFAADTVRSLYGALARKAERFERPGVIVHVGDVRTNLTEVTATVSTNGSRIVTRIWLRSPGFADLARYRLEVVKGFYRSVLRRELTDAEAVAAYRRSQPELRVIDERRRLEDWLSGCGTTNDEEGIRLMRRVFEPGKANRRDILIFASRLFLYPPQRDVKLAGKYDCLSFREAVKFGRIDSLTRAVACCKANDMPVFGGGRGADLEAAAMSYRAFLLAFAEGKAGKGELLDLLDDADAKLNAALERCEAREGARR